MTALLAACLAAPSVQPAVVFDARSLTWDERCTVEALQGLVNRHGPRLYLDNGYPWDRKWLDIYARRNGMRYRSVRGLRRLLEMFSSDVRGLVVYDPKLDGSRYVAITLAGVEDLLPVTPLLMAGRSIGMMASQQWAGFDFAADPTLADLLQPYAGAKFRAVAGRGLELTEGNANPGEPWSFVTFGPVTVDLARYPFLEVTVADIEPPGARWVVKLTWDRNGDGRVSGPQDDLVLPVPAPGPGTFRWNIAKLAGVSSVHTFYRIQLHALGPGAKVVYRSIAFADASGRRPPSPQPEPLTALGLEVCYDLRGKFHDSVAAYRWALKEVMRRCNRRFAHAVNGTVEGIRAGGGPFAGFDWPVMHGGFVFNLTCAPEKLRSYGQSVVGGSRRQARMYRRILASLEPPAMITGYGEPEGYWCRLLSENGHYSFHFGDNWSFHTKVPPRRKTLKQRRQLAPRDVTLAPDKFYVCLMTSEGDTMKGPIPFFYGSWFEPQRGETPINWGINPLMAEYFPAMLEYFYETATDNDYFFAGCSGAGYCYPDVMPNLEQFAQHTRRACRAADITCIDLWGAANRGVLARYAAITRPLGLTANFGRAALSFLPSGVPVVGQGLMYWQHRPAGGTNWQAFFADDAKRAGAVRWLVRRIEQIARRHYPPFVILAYSDLHNYAHHCRLASEIKSALDPRRFEVVRLDYALAGLRAWAASRVLVGLEGVGERLAWATLADVPTRLPLRLTNASARRKKATVAVDVGGRGAAEASVMLGPWESRLVDALQLKASRGAAARVVVRAAGHSAIFPVTVAVVPCAAKPASAELAGLWDAVGLRHGSGQPIDDEAALWGQAWVAKPSSDQPGHIVYGPYADLPAGSYLVAFRLKLLAAADPATPVADLDVFAGGESASHRTAARRALTVADFPAPGRWRWFVLEADWDGAPDMMETRVLWHGTVALAVDRVAVFKVPQP